MINRRRSAAATLLLSALAIGAQIGFAARVGAEPYPNCPFVTTVTYDVCSQTPGVPGLTPGFTLTEGVPGTWGPRGIYTPRIGHIWDQTN